MNHELAGWYRGKRVFLTGHTGFVGAWLTAWLKSIGAHVVGYALAPPEDRPSLFDVAQIGDGMESVIGDVRDGPALGAAVRAAQPEIVFHLAAQSLVRRSYRAPAETYETNVMGTVHLLEAARDAPTVRAVVVVTSDKCYENRGIDHAYREDEPMGGHDPYSSSKGCAELVTSAMRRSFFSDSPAAVASARAGNIIGGGDWAEGRLVPDLMRGATAGRPTVVRHPEGIRPWQFVLDPLRGYLVLGRALVEQGDPLAGAWNFGPMPGDAVSVAEVAAVVHAAWDRATVRFESDPAAAHEAAVLKLDSHKARARLGWQPVVPLPTAVELTVNWYRSFDEDAKSAAGLVAGQLRDYETRCRAVPAT